MLSLSLKSLLLHTYYLFASLKVEGRNLFRYQNNLELKVTHFCCLHVGKIMSPVSCAIVK